MSPVRSHQDGEINPRWLVTVMGEMNLVFIFCRVV